MRLDKLLANTGLYGSRKDVKNLLKKGLVVVNEQVTKDGSIHVRPEQDSIKVNNQAVHYQKYIYLLMNKPPGYISATVDKRDKTVIDLLTKELQAYKPFPVGRLDKDTEGLLLLTNNGALAHELLAPKKAIEKTYYAKIKGIVTKEDVQNFYEGITLDDGYKTKSAKLSILHSDVISEIEVTIIEGKFHQVKRMFAAVNKKVLYLRRIRMGELKLDHSLALGSYRELTDEELTYCQSL